MVVSCGYASAETAPTIDARASRRGLFGGFHKEIPATRNQSIFGTALPAAFLFPAPPAKLYLPLHLDSSAFLPKQCEWRFPMTKDRRGFIKAGVAGALATGAAQGKSKMQKKVYRRGEKPKGPSLYSGAVSYGNLLFIAGKGAHFEGDIKSHTKHVLDEIQTELENAGSSMDKVLQCRVFLNDLKDYAGMNEVFMGRFGPEPPVRTTIAAAGGIPGNSLVEIDVIAYI